MLALGLALAGVLSLADGASAGIAQITPTVIGSGEILVAGTSWCVVTKPEGQAQTCATRSFGLNPNSQNPGSATLTAVAPAGWTFVAWTAGCTGVAGPVCTVQSPVGVGFFPYAPVAQFVDSVGPDTAIDTGPGEGALQAINAETFKFSSTGAAGFECQLDGAGFTPCTSGIRLEGLAAGAHRFEVRSIDEWGFRGVPAVRTWSIAAADLDGDGFNARIDCDDTNPAIHPGAVDVPGNGVDENCDGADAAVPQPSSPSAPVADPERLVVTLAFFSTVKKATTRFTTLQVKNVPIGSTVAVTCRGKGCPKGLTGKGFTKANAFGTVTLAKFIKKPLRAGDKITVTVTKPNTIGAVKILTVRSAKKPVITTKCRLPGAKAPVAC